MPSGHPEGGSGMPSGFVPEGASPAASVLSDTL